MHLIGLDTHLYVVAELRVIEEDYRIGCTGSRLTNLIDYSYEVGGLNANWICIYRANNFLQICSKYMCVCVCVSMNIILI